MPFPNHVIRANACTMIVNDELPEPGAGTQLGTEPIFNVRTNVNIEAHATFHVDPGEAV